MSWDFQTTMAVGHGASGAFLASRPSLDAQVAADADPGRWLVDTPLLEHQHPKIRLLAARLTQLRAQPYQKALACYGYVRALPFGCSADSTSLSAPMVVRQGRGDCHTKGTLLVALLRALHIPARLRFLTLRPDFLHGILDLDGHPVEHACVEVLIDGRWVAVDSHVVDMRLAAAAQSALARQQRALGWGMHVLGRTSWDGHSDSFGQFDASDAHSLPLHDWGVFDDPYQFYSSVRYVRARLQWSTRLKWSLAARVVNRRVAALRSGALPSTQAALPQLHRTAA